MPSGVYPRPVKAYTKSQLVIIITTGISIITLHSRIWSENQALGNILTILVV